MPPRPPEPPDFAASQLFLRRLAFHLVRDEARAEDLVQETWATWVERRPKGLAEPRAWLARVLRNRAFNLKRSDERRARHEELAGRPDPSGPETDGTLEAQAQLLEALRKLEEPYRSTLVQRYYHDLSPSAIAERAGTPLNTVKARLARGLEKLRGEMDRRYHGDRRAWCHWLTVLGPPGAVPLERTRPSDRTPADPGGAPWLATTGSLAVGKSVLWTAVLLSALTWVLWRVERGPVSIELPPPDDAPSAAIKHELTAPRREAVPIPASRPQGAPKAQATPAVAPPPQAPFAEVLPFEWPQLGGTAAHRGLPGDAERKDLIVSPRVRFVLPGLLGQPTVHGKDLYAGGATLARVDLIESVSHGPEGEAAERIHAPTMGVDFDHRWEPYLASQGLSPQVRVAAAPVVTQNLVIARMVADGSVSAFDRDLTYVQWRWEPSDPGPCILTGSLVGDRYLAAHRREVVALRTLDGRVDWRFELEEGDRVNMVPASDGDLVYFGTERGSVYALDLARGKIEWRQSAGGSFGWFHPLAFVDRVVLIRLDSPDALDPRRYGQHELRAFQNYDGRLLWRKGLRFHSGAWMGFGGGDDEVWLVNRGLERRSADTGELHSLEYGQDTAWGAPRRIGDSLVAIEGPGLLVVRDAGQGRVRWAYRSQRSGFLDFVHAGDQIYVATSAGLLCLVDDPDAKPPAPGQIFGRAMPGDESLFDR
ncbi:MAG TPA: sigma-70 family RNA polymerase sigma factor [Planctomycetota bacterium]